MKLGSIVIDSNNSEELSEFYQKLLGWTKEVQFLDGDKWIILKSTNKECTPMVFQENEDYERPKWPSQGGLQQQMMHLDFYVNSNDYELEIQHAVSCGAIISETQLADKWKIMLDPAGHPFCIIPLPL